MAKNKKSEPQVTIEEVNELSTKFEKLVIEKMQECFDEHHPFTVLSCAIDGAIGAAETVLCSMEATLGHLENGCEKSELTITDMLQAMCSVSIKASSAVLKEKLKTAAKASKDFKSEKEG